MTFFRLIISSLRHYIKSNLFVASGIAISTAIITGALIVGDSVRYSLERTVNYRLGGITHTVTAGDRFFTSELVKKFALDEEYTVSAGLVLEGMALGRPVVTTSAGIEGIQADLKRDVIVADDPEAFRREVVKLVKDDIAAGKLVSHARGLIQENFDTFGLSLRLSRFFNEEI